MKYLKFVLILFLISCFDNKQDIKLVKVAYYDNKYQIEIVTDLNEKRIYFYNTKNYDPTPYPPPTMETFSSEFGFENYKKESAEYDNQNYISPFSAKLTEIEITDIKNRSKVMMNQKSEVSEFNAFHTNVLIFDSNGKFKNLNFDQVISKFNKNYLSNILNIAKSKTNNNANLKILNELTEEL
ncbi:hypothetical protein Q73A0000_03895 [Kaistella flava (ex Peng et al. 2021)]|uniref:Uncharacterized protein n=1 Tax=Kaistella flava (ex Peng et al. 2021) TaxID=2038776 RepID=A0A7M2Y649_9FLAO|nr:hypothetical protein [Kaistella flava (ex Peng et al. 2021)]QOW09566.1 hypothetical protein Q73A0000_03895 [Kaistella flava (ex Peng et al. 2021)]